MQVIRPAQATRKSSDRGVFLTAAIVVCSLVGVGFWPSYFSKILSSQSEPLTALVHSHGALMTAWIGLFITQVSLVAVGRTDLHRRVGRLGFALLALTFIVAVPMTITATRLGGHHMPGPALPGLALVIGLFVQFFTLAGLGLAYRRSSDIHKRLMLLAACAAMEAGVSRLPVDMLNSVVKVHLANDFLVLVVIVVDTFRNRRLHPAFLWGGAFLLFMQMLSTWASGTDTWLHIAQGIMGHFP